AQRRFVREREAGRDAKKSGGYVGLSGYVLQTGHSKFSANPRTDALWTGEADDKIHEVIGRLQSRFETQDPLAPEPQNKSPEQQNTFLMPLCIQRSRAMRSLPRICHDADPTLETDSISATEVRLFVECRLPQLKEDQLLVRRNLFDLAWEFMPAIEA